mmetsp:Transcript_89648/g.254148  ORF Transcript_89648/g.254148 Transcript_89648/m.254148 type:complete len:223 (-) Transcript_89648:120-788(-)
MGEQWSFGSTSVHLNSPKYSFTNAPIASDKKKDIPGPGQYGFTATHTDKFSRSASWGISGSSREGKPWFAPPGPGTYKPEQSTRAAPRWVFGSEGKLREMKRATVPGPGAYEVRGKADSGGSLMAPKPEATRRVHTPGPGAYKPAHEALSHMKASTKSSFGSSSRSTLVLSTTPGPGSYDHLASLGGNIAMQTSAKYTIQGKYKPPQPDKTPDFIPAGTSFK